MSVLWIFTSRSMPKELSFLSVASFLKWTQATRVRLADVTKLLPPYAATYDPTVVASMGKVNAALGLTGAGGGFYNPADPEQP